MELKTGIPIIEDYEKLKNNPIFKEMEFFSNNFLKNNEKVLNGYSLKWVKDPFHQWSRQYEYPFVFTNIKKKSKLNILDAGSGITFFPYYLQKTFPYSDIYCCDHDKYLQKYFNDINANENANISFDICDLNNTEYPDNHFDYIYSISVLEHTNNYSDIIKEFKRILKPNGRLILTFDISLERNDNLGINNAKNIINILNNNLSPYNEINLDSELIKNNILTTHYAQNNYPSTLPWKSYIKFIKKLKNLVYNKKFSIPEYSIICHVLSKEII
jgi:ubiquinone/menaquinone biosynthesis C-methylase UbiE